MAFLNTESLYRLMTFVPGLLLSLTVHEFAHARVALAFGDPTAKYLGRVTLNPLKHLDPIGTIAIIVTQLGGVGFGWAKPVPVNPLNLYPRRLGDILVSLAGPLSNLTLAAVLLGALKLWMHLGPARIPEPLFTNGFLWCLVIMLVNVTLCVFNLVPLFPLDGHHILRELLPAETREPFMRWQMRFGPPVLMALIFLPGLLGRIGQGNVPNPLGYLFGTVHRFVLSLTGLGGV